MKNSVHFYLLKLFYFQLSVLENVQVSKILNSFCEKNHFEQEIRFIISFQIPKLKRTIPHWWNQFEQIQVSCTILLLRVEFL
jgi:hypothetical protein